MIKEDYGNLKRTSMIKMTNHVNISRVMTTKVMNNCVLSLFLFINSQKFPVKEQKGLLNVIAQLRQQIKVLRMRKREKMTSGVRHATTPVRPPKKKVRRTHVQLTIQNPVEELSVV